MLLLLLLAGVGLAMGMVGPLQADEQVAWEALGPTEEQVTRLFTPASGALLARTKSDLWRSNDGGLTWAAVPLPAETDLVTVSPTSHDVLYAAGAGGVFRSEHGGSDWRRISDHAGNWVQLEVSPADPARLYGVEITSPPADYGQNRWHEFLVSRDGGASWENVRTVRDRVLLGTAPCAYTVRTLRPHAIDPLRVMTIEDCSRREVEPQSRQSLNEGRDVELFPNQRGLAAISMIGGSGVDPARWYVALYLPGTAYTRMSRSRLVRSDDDGRSWTTLVESYSGSPDLDTVQPVDFVTALAYNPDRPDEVYAVFEHREPVIHDGAVSGFRATSSTVRASQDGGNTWSDLGGADGPRFTGLAIGVDRRYLFAATTTGVYRIAVRR